MAARTKKKKTITSALHQLVLKLNPGALNWHQQMRAWFSQFNISSLIFKSIRFLWLLIIWNSNTPWHPTRPVCIFFVFSNFYYIFWFPAGDMKMWDIFLPFILFLLSGFDRSKCSLLERVDGVKLYTDPSYDYLFSKSNLIFLSNISIHITWHHWQNNFK